MQHVTNIHSGRMTRRQLLGVAGATGLTAALAACGVSTQSNLQKIAAGKFKIVHSGAKLPTSDIEIKWMDSGDNKATFFNAFFPAYTNAHPNIKVNYTGTNWPAIQQIITLGLHNGTAPDAFQLPPTITGAQAVDNKWVVPLDDLFPKFSQWKARFPAGTFADGITDFAGKTYGMPLVSDVRFNYLTLYNSDYMKRAGFDPSSKPLSWEEFRTALKKITKQGNGKYYGVIAGNSQTGTISGFVDTLAQMAGAHTAGPVNPFTGHYNYTSDEYIAAMELVLAINSDGSYFPGSNALDGATAMERFPTGVAGVLMDGPWDVSPWLQQNPGFKFGLGLPPVQKDLASSFPLGRGPGGAGKWFIPATSKVAAVIADIYFNIMTADGQAQWNDYDGGADPSLFPTAMAQAKLNPLVQKSYDLAQKYTVLAPEPAVRTPTIGAVYEAQITPTPSWSDVAVGLFTGQISGSVKTAMTKLQDSYEASLDTAIKTVNQREGTNVTRNDFLFKDWDPKKNYTKLYPSNS